LKSLETGRLAFHPAPAPSLVRARRHLIVYLPPGYRSARSRRYPVLYLHDGQNLFDASTAFLGNHWRLQETVDDMIQMGEIRPLVLVGIYNSGEQRVDEYTHVKDRRGCGGGAHFYGEFLVNDLKPFIDRKYRTLPDAPNTGLGGSSLGGLVTLYLGLRYPQVFGRLMLMSPSIWWARRAILKTVRKIDKKPPTRIWLDIGTHEGQKPEEYVRDTAELRDLLIAKGWQLGVDLAYLEDEGAGHEEKAWGSRTRHALRFLFPPTTSKRNRTLRQ
jgi:predicted alpha/beta superfamily hydrolase